jgi:hypothetical protein
MLFVAGMRDRRRTALPAACHSTRRVSARRRFGTGRCLFRAFQTLSNLALRQNCTKSDARGFETAPVRPNEAENLMRPALDLRGPRHRSRMRLHVRSTSGLTRLGARFF